MAVPKHFLHMTDFKTLGSCTLKSMQLSSSATDTCLQGEMDLFDPASCSPSEKIDCAWCHSIHFPCFRAHGGPFTMRNVAVMVLVIFLPHSCSRLAQSSPSIGSSRSCVTKTLSIRHSSLERREFACFLHHDSQLHLFTRECTTHEPEFTERD